MILCTTINTNTSLLEVLGLLWAPQNLKDPVLDSGDDLAFGIEIRDEVSEVSKSAEVNAKRVGAFCARIGVPDGIQDLMCSSGSIPLDQTKA